MPCGTELWDFNQGIDSFTKKKKKKKKKKPQNSLNKNTIYSFNFHNGMFKWALTVCFNQYQNVSISYVVGIDKMVVRPAYPKPFPSLIRRRKSNANILA